MAYGGRPSRVSLPSYRMCSLLLNVFSIWHMVEGLLEWASPLAACPSVVCMRNKGAAHKMCSLYIEFVLYVSAKCWRCSWLLCAFCVCVCVLWVPYLSLSLCACLCVCACVCVCVFQGSQCKGWGGCEGTWNQGPQGAIRHQQGGTRPLWKLMLEALQDPTLIFLTVAAFISLFIGVSYFI